jgi:hypothetical protein
LTSDPDLSVNCFSIILFYHPEMYQVLTFNTRTATASCM